MTNLHRRIRFDLPVYTFDIDFNGHVSNIVYVRWMEIGRIKLLEAVGMPPAKIAEKGFGPVLTETHISYKHPLRLSDTVVAELWLSELAHASAWMEFRFFSGGGILAASGRQKGLFIQFDTGRPRKLSLEERALFEPYLDTGQSLGNID